MNATLRVIAAATAVTMAATAPPTIAAPTTTTTRINATVAEVSSSRIGRSASPMPTVASTPSAVPSAGALPELGMRAIREILTRYFCAVSRS